MKFNKSKYPILGTIERVKNNENITIEKLFNYEDLSFNLHLINSIEEGFKDILRNGERLYFVKHIRDRIHRKDFGFFDKIDSFCEADISFTGVLLEAPKMQTCFRCLPLNNGEWHMLILLVHEESTLFTVVTTRLYKDEGGWRMESNGIGPSENLIPEFDFQPSDFVLKILLHIIFKKYAPIEYVVTNKNNKKAKINNQKFINESESEVTIIDSSWFTNITRTKGFNVRGHFALRACGVGRKDRRLVWIKGFKKNGYKRQAKKLADSENLQTKI